MQSICDIRGATCISDAVFHSGMFESYICLDLTLVVLTKTLLLWATYVLATVSTDRRAERKGIILKRRLGGAHRVHFEHLLHFS